MRLLEQISEDEMVATFLKAEITSIRFGHEIISRLERDEVNREIIDQPNTRDNEQNAYRAKVLGEYRGYQQNRELFENYPDDVVWYRALLTREELATVRYIDYSYWNEISSGTRLPTEAARTIRSGRSIYGQSTEGFLKIAQALSEGARFPELILVGTAPEEPLTVLEGHVRLTAFFLAPECLPVEISVLVGFAPEFASW